MSDGVRLSTPDALIAATARSTGAELVVADGDFETDVLDSSLTVTNLRK
jgi:predicted nucleic acid-binding protein